VRRLPPPLRDAVVALTVAVCLFGVMRLAATTDALGMLEAASLDTRFRVRGPIPPGPETTIILADDASLAVLGRWPFSRHVLARAVRLLDSAGARVVAFDMLFPEADTNPPEGWRAALRQWSTAEGADKDAKAAALAALAGDDPDADLAKAIHDFGHVVLPVALSDKGADSSEPDSLAASGFQSFDRTMAKPAFRLQPTSAILPVAPLDSAAAALGHVTTTYEVDGRMRYAYLSLPYQGDFLPSLSLRAAAFWLDPDWSKTALAPGEAVRIGSEIIPTDAAGRMVVNFRGPKGTFPTYSLIDLLNGQVPAAALKDRVVIMGASFTGNEDTNPAPFGRQLMPGAEFHANVVDSILHQDFIRIPDPAQVGLWSLGALLVLGCAAALSSVLTTWSGGIVVLLPAAAAALLIQLAFNRGLWVPAIGGLVALIGGGLSVILFRYLMVDREGRRVKSAFRRYLAPALVNRIAANPGRLRLGGEKRQLTLMFCDIRGFSGVSEGYRDDPQGLTRLINRFLTPMTDIILARQGTIDKYMGDCIMAFWNAPLDDPDHAAHSCDSALAMFSALDRLNEELAREGSAPLRIGIGLNTGTCVVGNMGSEQRFDYSVLGDAVNLASRLEGQSKTYGVGIVVGEDTRTAAPDHAMLEIDRIVVKGKSEPVSIFALLGTAELARSEPFRALEAPHATLLACYRRQDWDGAEAALEQCRGLLGGLDGLHALYADRIANFRQSPPPADWDGVYIALSK